MAAPRGRLARPGSFVVATEIVASRGVVTDDGGGAESQCAKNLGNGPCGGTREGLSEVYDTECIWSQAYERLQAHGEEESMLDGPVVVKDNALAGTSAWANAFLGRNHVGRENET
jgi:hypothetical protein